MQHLSELRVGELRPPWIWWSLVPLALACAAVAVPYLWLHGSIATALALQRGFALVCHQRPERSFVLFGGTVAVCSRCLGIYLGAAVGLLFRASRRMALGLFIVAAALNLIDIASEFAGLHGNWLGVRLGLGLLLGAAAGLMVSSMSDQRFRPFGTLPVS